LGFDDADVLEGRLGDHRGDVVTICKCAYGFQVVELDRV
jgi:hypothetical protein